MAQVGDLRSAQPRKPKKPMPGAQGQRGATPSSHPSKPAVLGALTNLATLSGGSQPSGLGQVQGGDQNAQTSWQSDPILQQINALQQTNTEVANAQALASRQQALINFGYSDALGSLYGDKGTEGAAQANPYSVLKQLGEQHNLRQKGLNENLNRANLFYSSTRGEQLGQESKQYIGEQDSAGQALQAQLGGIEVSRLGALQSAQGAQLQGQQDAYDRYLNQQLQYGLGGTGTTSTSGALTSKQTAAASARTAIAARSRPKPRPAIQHMAGRGQVGY